MTYKIIDLFAGPGGLGEGFASFGDGKVFEIAVSAEMEASAHQTLMLRSFFRHARKEGDRQALDAYYNFCNLPNSLHPRDAVPRMWERAITEAHQLTLGSKAGNEVLDSLIEAAKLKSDSTVVIGGPPCQAYSLVGRSRNLGKANYVAENDHRHFLYKEYLRILKKVSPAVFVMENVKGILSSKINNRLVFNDILQDLSNPSKATLAGDGPEYIIHSLVTDTTFSYGMDPEFIDPKNFIIHAEKFGIPQARHRVILLGVRKDVLTGRPIDRLQQAKTWIDVEQALVDIPPLRSKLSNADSSEAWALTTKDLACKLALEASQYGKDLISTALANHQLGFLDNLDTGSLRLRRTQALTCSVNKFTRWVCDERLDVWLNHETRSHMNSDLGRYLFASTFAECYSKPPKGHHDFALPSLAPAHANWKTGKFADRFRVQMYERPSTTVTSHIAKDGHYFIHPDPLQCRSLTVREAARLQTFPDNYFFQGNRTQQFHQVGNAVPSLLANQIAEICESLLNGKTLGAKHP